jgi:hypothetical protein
LGDVERVVVVGLRSQLFQALCEGAIRALRANDLQRDAGGVLLTTDLGEALEGPSNSSPDRTARDRRLARPT